MLLNIDELRNELSDNKDLIKMTESKGGDGDSAGSDSEPSEDNLEESEMAELVPIKPKKKKSDLNKRNRLMMAGKKKNESVPPAKDPKLL